MAHPSSLVAQRVKPAMQETWVRSWGWEDPWRRKRQPTPVFLPGKSHGWRSLVQAAVHGLQRVRHDGATSLSLSRVGTSSQTKLRTLPHEETGRGLSFWSQLMAYPLPTTDQPGHYEKSSHVSSHIRPRSSNSLSPLSETFKVQMYELA